ncbi:hypothetical protein Nwi_1994 [Nitrobacter winogradskyi Nb-255]|uniref:Uncharacterized protein n=2 Tax=Nitrobacter winogradskyi TaxID=913 RepID=Q3SR38_NITWN|nr:hypothetical protein Nwi_1994 [Nitrobacter winogradskyi Nb-255]
MCDDASHHLKLARPLQSLTTKGHRTQTARKLPRYVTRPRIMSVLDVYVYVIPFLVISATIGAVLWNRRKINRARASDINKKPEDESLSASD